VILVLDGHGEAGHVVSTYYKQRFCDEVFAHATWPDGLEGMRESIRDVLFKLEAELINDAGIDTDFSGSTFVFAAMRDNVLLVANVRQMPRARKGRSALFRRALERLYGFENFE